MRLKSLAGWLGASYLVVILAGTRGKASRNGRLVSELRFVGGARVNRRPRAFFYGPDKSTHGYKSFLYQAASWKTARRVVAKVVFHFGELFPRVGFIVTNLETDSRAVVRFYNTRGTAEQWIEEGKQAVKMTRLSCHRFRSNEVRLWLSLMAYNLGTCGGGWCCRRGSRSGR